MKKFRKKIYVLLFLLLAAGQLSFLIPEKNVIAAASLKFTDESHTKIEEKTQDGKTITYEKVTSDEDDNVLNPKTGAADRNMSILSADRIKYPEPQYQRPLKFALFRSSTWQNNKDGSRYIRMTDAEWRNAKELHQDVNTAENWETDLACVLGICKWLAPKNLGAAATIKAYSKYSFFWTEFPGLDGLDDKNQTFSIPPKIVWSEGTLTTQVGGKQDTFVSGKNKLVVDLDGAESLYDKTVLSGEGEADLPSRGSYYPNGAATGIPVPIDLHARPGDLQSNIECKVYFGSDDAKNLIGNFGTYYLNDHGTTIKNLNDEKKVYEGELDFNNSTCKFQDIPVPGKYQIEVAILTKNELQKAAEIIGNPIEKLLKGDENFWLYGKKDVEIKYDANNRPTPTSVKLFITEIKKTTTPSPIASVVNDALEDAVNYVVDLCLKGLEMFMGWVNGILNRGNFMGDDPSLKEIWKSIRNITLSVLTLGILLIAFANILQIDIEKYNVTRMIPKLVIATVMSYFSFLIANFILSICAAIQVKLISETGASNITSSMNSFGTSAYETLKAPGEMIVYAIALIIVMVIALLAALILCILLISRIAVLWLLVAVAPLAFMMQVMPFTEHLYMDWWNKFFKWAFMGPAVMFMLYLASEVIDASSAGIASPESSPIFQLLMAGILIFMATIIPFTMGGEVFKGIGIDQQTMWRQVPGFKEGQSLIKQRSKPSADRADRRATAARSWMANRRGLGGAAGRFAAGVTKEEAVGLSGQPKEDRKKVFDGADKKALNNYIAETEGKGAWGEAAFDHAAEKGKLDLENDKVAEVVEAKLATDFDKLVKSITKEAPDAFAKAVNAGRGGPQMARAADESIRRRKDEDLKEADLQFMHNQITAGTASPRITFRVNEVGSNADKLDKILGLSHDLQGEWGHVLHAAGHRGASGNADIDRRVTQILAAR